MNSAPSEKVVLIMESAADDEALTRRALERTGIPIYVLAERTGDTAVSRYLADFSSSPPGLVIVADGLLRLSTREVVLALREVHDSVVLPILHLLSSEHQAAAEGASGWLVKPIAYAEYLEKVGAAARDLLVGHRA